MSLSKTLLPSSSPLSSHSRLCVSSLSSPSSHVCFLYSSLFCLTLSLSVSLSGGVKCKAETGAVHSVCESTAPRGTGSFQGPRTSLAFVRPARPRQREWEEEQSFNKNIVCEAFRQLTTMCAAHYRERMNQPGQGSRARWDDRRTKITSGGQRLIFGAKGQVDRREFPNSESA